MRIEPYLWILAWIGFVPLFLLLKNKTPKKAFLISYLVGLAYFLFTVYWLVYVTLAGLIVLVLYLALYFGAFGLIFSYVEKKPRPVLDLFLIPSAWVVLEYIRSHLFTGFGWELLGYTQYKILPIIQIADIAGAYGVSFLIMMVNYALYKLCFGPWAMSYEQIKKKMPVILLPILLLNITLIYGYFRINSYPLSAKRYPLRISIVQGNIPQEQKWDEEYRNSIIDKYIDLTKLAAKDKPDLIIWPETAVPGFLNIEEDLQKKIVALEEEIKIPLLAGTPIYKFTGKDSYYNSAILISEDKKFDKRYDKLHLVPFGEYIPFEDKLPFLRAGRLDEITGFSPGKEFTIFEVKDAKFGVLICFEDIFPGLVRQFNKRGADFMVVITNDAWFKKTKAPYQHAAASVFRAVENRVNIIRAANTGLSCFIDKNGTITESVKNSEGKEIFITGIKTYDINTGKHKTLYTKYGDFIFYVYISIITAGLARKRV